MESYLKTLVNPSTQSAPGWEDHLFLARLTAVYTLTHTDVTTLGSVYYGMAAGTNLYGFIEQIFDPTTGTPVDADNARQTVFTSTFPTSAFALEANNQNVAAPGTTPAGYANPGPYVTMKLKGIVGGSPTFEFYWGGDSLAWVKATSSTLSTIYLGRTVADAVEISSSTTLTSASANFTNDDVGATLIGSNIPANTTISSVTNSTTVVMSHAATSSASGVTVQIVTGTTTGYAAVIDSWSNKTGAWSDGTAVWLVGVNTESFSSGRRYQCRYMGTDDNNVQIWGTSLAIPYMTTSTGSGSLATSWTTILSLTLPANTTWKLETQLTASLASSASGAFDYLSARYYDGSTVHGVVADFCYAACDSITVPGTVCVKTIIAVGGSALTIDVQTQINTSSGSTASLVGAEFDAIQLQ